MFVIIYEDNDYKEAYPEKQAFLKKDQAEAFLESEYGWKKLSDSKYQLENRDWYTAEIHEVHLTI